jgi:hypothetical protein
MFHQQDGRTWTCQLFYGDTFALEYVSGDVSNLTTAVHNAWATNVVPLLSTGVSLTDTIGTDLFSETAPRYELPSAVPGTQADEALSLNIAAVVKRVQDRRYRGGKSHIYVGGLTVERLADPSFFVSGFITGLVAAVDACDTAAETVTSSHGHAFQPIAVSYFNGGVERVTPALFNIATTAGQERVCTRRRRLPKIAG